MLCLEPPPHSHQQYPSTRQTSERVSRLPTDVCESAWAASLNARKNSTTARLMAFCSSQETWCGCTTLQLHGASPRSFIARGLVRIASYTGCQMLSIASSILRHDGSVRWCTLTASSPAPQTCVFLKTLRELDRGLLLQPQPRLLVQPSNFWRVRIPICPRLGHTLRPLPSTPAVTVLRLIDCFPSSPTEFGMNYSWRGAM